MGQIVCTASPDKRYWINLEVGGLVFPWMLDTGLTDPLNWLGFEADPVTFERLRSQAKFFTIEYRLRRDASGRRFMMEAGMLHARLFDPVSQQAVGPTVPIFVGKGYAGVPSRVGTPFFHRLQGCSVHWDLDNRIWCISYP